MMRHGAKAEKLHFYPRPLHFRKFVDGLTALVELAIKVAAFNPVFFFFLKSRNPMKIMYWEARTLLLPGAAALKSAVIHCD